jgi:hypothetical protein
VAGIGKSARLLIKLKEIRLKLRLSSSAPTPDREICLTISTGKLGNKQVAIITVAKSSSLNLVTRNEKLGRTMKKIYR